MSSAPCKECGRRPKYKTRHRCITCALRHEPIGVQVAAAQRRLAMVPEDMRVKRSKTILAQAPAGTSWCAGCQSFRDLEDFGKNATQCRACISAKSHSAMIEKTYGLTSDDYDELLALQGGGCAVCGGKPKSKRLAVDHDHQTGAVRGLVCSRHNHEALGALNDSLAMVTALWHYLNTPPAQGAWSPLTSQPQLAPVESATRPSKPSLEDMGIVTQTSSKPSRAANVATPDAECTKPHFVPAGSQSVPGKRGLWKVWASADPETPAPF